MESGRKPYPFHAVLLFPWWALIILGGIEDLFREKYHFLESLEFINLLSIWFLFQAGWLRRADRSSFAIYWYLGAFALGLLQAFGEMLGSRVASNVLEYLCAAVFLAAIFIFRHEMMRYFNGKDDVGLRLSAWMSPFFNMIYFQYHFNEIARFKLRNPEPTTPVAR